MIRLSLVLVGALVIATAAFGQSTSIPTLKGTVGPSFTISLTKAGLKVKTLKAGTYRFSVSDKSAIHNFTLQRVTTPTTTKVVTSTAFTGSKSANVKLTRGRWEYFCSVHKSLMHA